MNRIEFALSMLILVFGILLLLPDLAFGEEPLPCNHPKAITYLEEMVKKDHPGSSEVSVLKAYDPDTGPQPAEPVELDYTDRCYSIISFTREDKGYIVIYTYDVERKVK